jgi:hypothetical protein
MTKLVQSLCALALVASGSIVFTSPVVAQGPAKCAERDILVKGLKDKYKEIPVALGISQKNTRAFEIFASEEGTWTVMMTLTNGQSCIMAAGHSWQDMPKELAGTPS